MRYLFFILAFFWIWLDLSAQVDSTAQKPVNTTKPFETDTQQIKRYFQENFEYKNSKETKSSYDKSMIFQMKKGVVKSKFETEALIIGKPEFTITSSDKAIHPDPGEEPDDTKQVLKGPSQFDSRIEIRDLNPLIKWQQQILNNERSVCIVIEKEMIHQVTDSMYQLDISSTLGSLYNLCPGEAFRDQPVVGLGTAFIIDDQTLMTASHVFSRPIENYVIVFGFEMVNKTGAYEAFIPAKDIYYPKKIIYTSDDLDVTGFTIDRSLIRPALKWSDSQNLPVDLPVYMLGHPMGLPKKVALNAGITDNKNPLFFYTSLDAFQGNSGSPVFRLDTHELIGILVSGELDYKWNGSCNASTLCGIPYCNGEKVIRIEEIMNDLNEQ